MSEAPRQEWPREIWMAERDEHDQGVVTAVLSEHATVARWEGDKERDRDFHRYVDGDIHDSAKRYCKAMVAAAYEKAAGWCSDEADLCDDAVKWGGSRKYITDAKAASYALRNADGKIRALTPADANAALDAVKAEARREERERCHKIAMDHRPDRPLASRATAGAIAAAIKGDAK